MRHVTCIAQRPSWAFLGLLAILLLSGASCKDSSDTADSSRNQPRSKPVGAEGPKPPPPAAEPPTPPRVDAKPNPVPAPTASGDAPSAAVAALERPATPAPPAGPAPTTLPPKRIGDFDIPRIDLVGLPRAVRMEIISAYDEAANSPDVPARIGELGMYYHAVGNSLDAIPCFDRASRLEPKELRWWYYLALAHIATYNTQKAIESFESAIRVDPNYPAAMVQLADLLQESDPSRSLELYQAALKLSPWDARAHLGLGEVALQKGDLDGAETHITKTLELAPKFGEANGAMARLMTARGRSEEAAHYLELEKSGAQPPLVNDPLLIDLLRRAAGGDDLLILAERLSRAGQVDHAIAILQQAIEKNSSAISTRHALGVLLGIKGRFSEAAQEFRFVLQKNPYQFKTMVDLARALMRLGNYTEADQLLREVLTSGAYDARAVILYGDLLLETGRAEDAVRYLQGVSKVRPDFVDSHMALAKGMVCLQKFDAAIESYRKAQELSAVEPMAANFFVWELIRLMADQRRAAAAGANVTSFLSPDTLTDLARSLESVGLTEEAKAARDYEEVIARRVARFADRGAFLEAESIFKVAILNVKPGQEPRLVELLREEMSKAPESPGVRHLLGLVLSAVGNKAAAAAEWRQLIGTHPTFELSYVTWSVDLMAAGKFAEAQELLREGLKQVPQSPLLANTIAWALSTSPQEKQRNPAEAVEWGERACGWTAYKDPELLDTLAAAYAAAGKFSDAVKMEQEAMKVAGQLGQQMLIPMYRKRLGLYESNQAYHAGMGQ